jgi:crotonobetainyl-CoA:carnitine CoA-transferase CaiB-like acyl-CoA transferase
VPALRHLATVAGEDTRTVLSEVGYDAAEVAELFQTGAAA